MSFGLATVLLDPPSTLIFGCALAALSAKLIRANPSPGLRKTVILSAGWSAWYGLCVAWFFFKRPDWMFVYLLDTAKVPLAPAFIAFWLVLIGYGAIGALGTGLLMQQEKTALGVAASAMAVVSMAFIFAITGDQYVHVGTTAQYLAGNAPVLDEDSTMKLALNVSGAGIVVGILAVLVLQFRKPRAA